MIFWIGSGVISIIIVTVAGIKLVRRSVNPRWPAAFVLGLASLATLGSAIMFTIESKNLSINEREQQSGGHSEKVKPGDSFDNLVENLKNDLKKNPARIEGWSLLGRSYVALGQLDDAVDAFRQAVNRSDKPNAGQISELAETLVAAAGGRVNEEPEQLFAQVLTMNPADPRARYYLAEALITRGDISGGQKALTAMLNSAPADAPWRMTVVERLRELAEKTPDFPIDKPGPGPTREQMQDAANLSPEERTEMIQAMVNGLAEKMKNNPDDYSGWLRLANSYMVLGNEEKASAALQSALALQPGNVGLLIQYAEIEISLNRGQISKAAENALLRALKREAGNPQAIWRLGQAAAQRGDKLEARRLWSELLPKLLAADPLKAEVKKALDELQ